MEELKEEAKVEATDEDENVTAETFDNANNAVVEESKESEF